MAPADKAAGNFIVICKKLYVTIIMNELGIDVDHRAVVNMAYSYSVSKSKGGYN